MTQSNGFIISTNNSNGNQSHNNITSSTDNNNIDNYSQSIRIGLTNHTSFTPFQSPSWPISAISFDTQPSYPFNLSGGSDNTILYRNDQQSKTDQVYDPFIPHGSIYSRGFSMKYRNSTIRRRLFENGQSHE